jgi:hypothetical protein
MHREQARLTRAYEWKRRWVVMSGPFLVVFGDIPAAHKTPSPTAADSAVLCPVDNIVWALDFSTGCHVEIVANDVRTCRCGECMPVDVCVRVMISLQSLDAALESTLCFGIAAAPHIDGIALSTETFSSVNPDTHVISSPLPASHGVAPTPPVISAAGTAQLLAAQAAKRAM